MATKLHIKRILPYPAEDLYNVVANVRDYPNFLPGCKKAIIHSETSDEILAELVIGYKMFTERFLSQVLLTPNKRVEVIYKKGPFKHLQHYWAFMPTNDQQTEIEFFIDFEFKSRILQKMMEAVFENSTDLLVQAFEKRLRIIMRPV
jgi:coenzyme Q-binding protein COQ10